MKIELRNCTAKIECREGIVEVRDAKTGVLLFSAEPDQMFELITALMVITPRLTCSSDLLDIKEAAKTP